MKRITLCADDFGMHPGVSEAIIKLASLQRIQATSCLVTAPGWHENINELTRFQESLDIGLHLNFTEGPGLSPSFKKGLPGLLSMLCRSHLGLLKGPELEEEITRQLKCFIKVMGTTPDFIDGHQHVHHLPGVRKALLTVIRKMALPPLWVRSVTPMISSASFLKTRVIVQSGALSLRADLHQTGLETNSAFAGVYSLTPNAPFPKLMEQWLRKLPDRGLIMCHPGLHNNQPLLPDHSEARQKEFDYLQSSQFISDCAGANVCLSKLPPATDPTCN